MTSHRVEAPDGLDEGIRIVCEDHGRSEQFQPGYRKVAFHCDGCGLEIGIDLQDTEDWRDLGEMC